MYTDWETDALFATIKMDSTIEMSKRICLAVTYVKHEWDCRKDIGRSRISYGGMEYL